MLPGDVTAKMNIRPGDFERYQCAHRPVTGSVDIDQWSVKDENATITAWRLASQTLTLEHLPCALLWHASNMGLTPQGLLHDIWGSDSSLQCYNPGNVIGAPDKGSLVGYLDRFAAECFTRRWCDSCYRNKMADVGQKILRIIAPQGVNRALMINHVAQQAQGALL